jgi:hypothetical protein
MEPKNFRECYFVQGFLDTLAEYFEDVPPVYQPLRRTFDSRTFQIYDALVFKYIDEENRAKIPEEPEAYHKRLVSEKLPVENLEDFQLILGHLKTIVTAVPTRASNLINGTGYLLESIISRDPELGFSVINYFLQEGIMTGINPWQLLQAFYTHDLNFDSRLYSLITTIPFPSRQFWHERYFDALPDALVTVKAAENLVACYRSSERNNWQIYVRYLLRFEAVRPDTIYDLFQGLYRRREADKNFSYKIDHQFYALYPAIIEHHPDFAQELYLQQEVLDSHFDHDAKEFSLILSKIPGFFERYLHFIIQYKSDSYGSSKKQLGILWRLPNGADLVRHAIVSISKAKYLYAAGELCSIFFYPMNNADKVKAYGVLDRLVNDHTDNINMLNLVLNITRNRLSDVYWIYLEKVVCGCKDLELFKKLQFYNNHFTSSGNQIWEDFKIAQLGKVYEIMSGLPNRLDFIEHRDWLSRTMSAYKTYADNERRLIFKGLR